MSISVHMTHSIFVMIKMQRTNKRHISHDSVQNVFQLKERELNTKDSLPVYTELQLTKYTALLVRD